MRRTRVGISIAVLSSILCREVCAQEFGSVKTFGNEGRLFSSGTDDYYLLSLKSYVTEDSGGYQGEVRVVKKFLGGGYELKFKDFIARCTAPFDHKVQIMWSEHGHDNFDEPVPIGDPNKFPGQKEKDSYNLYWATCHGRFQKFK